MGQIPVLLKVAGAIVLYPSFVVLAGATVLPKQLSHTMFSLTDGYTSGYQAPGITPMSPPRPECLHGSCYFVQTIPVTFTISDWHSACYLLHGGDNLLEQTTCTEWMCNNGFYWVQGATVYQGCDSNTIGNQSHPCPDGSCIP